MLGLSVYWTQLSFSQANSDPFAFFQPSITITAAERGQLDRGSPVSRVLSAKGLEVAVLAAIPVNIDGDRLVAWERRTEELKKSSYVAAIGRFSDPPRIEDLSGLELDNNDVGAIRSCRPRNCDLKISAEEMTRLQGVLAQGEGDKNEAIQQAFRRLVLDRVQEFLTSGFIPPGEDHRDQVQPSAQFAVLLAHTPFLKDRLPGLTEDLKSFPAKTHGGESFLYWSKERLARKPTISVTQLTIVRNQAPELPEVLIIGRDIFSTHYVDASLSVTALMRGNSNNTNYLVYVNRTEVDVLHGMLGGLIRRSIQDRMKDAANLLQDLRQRLESGDPPTESRSSGGEGSTRP